MSLCHRIVFVDSIIHSFIKFNSILSYLFIIIIKPFAHLSISVRSLLSPPPHSSSLLHLLFFISPSLLSLSYLILLLSNRYRSLVSLCVVSRLSQGHTSHVYGVAFGPGDLLASGSGDNTIKLWDIKTGKNVSTLTVCTLHSFTCVIFY